jgi:O-antigen ligase
MTLAPSIERLHTKRQARILDVLRGNWLVFFTVLAVPISYLPYELTSARWPPTYPFFALVVVTGVLTGIVGRRPSAVDYALIALGGWIALDLTIMGVGTSTAPWNQLTRELLTLFAGLVLFRIAQTPERKLPIVYGLRASLVLCGGWGVYQYFVGLPFLLSQGYGRGFYFATADGEYRPFGTFLSPTVYGGFLAMLGIAVIATLTNGWYFWIASIAVTSVLLMTETRSAIIGFAIAYAVVLFRSGRARGIRLAVAIAAMGYAIIGYQFWKPPYVASAIERLFSASDDADTSSVTRQALWQGVVDGLNQQDAWLTGFLAQDFVSTISPYTGLRVARLGHPHSNYFQELYRYGIPGLLLFLALLAAIWWTIRQGRTSVPLGINTAALAGVIVFAVDSVFNNSLSSLNVFAGLLLISGLGSVPTQRRQDVERA